MSDRQDSSDEARRGGFGTFTWLLVLLLVLYPLSTGPALKLAEHDVISLDALEYVYAPLGWLAQHSPPVQAFFDWYLGDVWDWSIFK
jgi:hypothetical protein